LLVNFYLFKFLFLRKYGFVKAVGDVWVINPDRT
jgi:hypothetical protein